MVPTSLCRAARALFLATALATPALLLAEDAEQIEYRLHIMRTFAAEMSSMDLIVQERAPADSFATHAKVLGIAAATAKAAFQDKLPSQYAKPEIWDNWSDFEQRLDALVASTQALAKAAQSEGLATARAKVQETAQVCKGCHDMYRVPKK